MKPRPVKPPPLKPPPLKPLRPVKNAVTGTPRHLARRLPLHTRLTIMTTAAVALAVAVVAAAAWFSARGELRGQIDRSLRGQAATMALHGTDLAADLCGGHAGPGPHGPPGPPEFGVQVIREDGARCGVSSYTAVVTGADQALAAYGSAGQQALRDGSTRNGMHVRVVTVALGNGSALVLTRPLTDTDTTLGNLAVVLLIVGVAGIGAAAACGLFVSRAGLRPVDRLTEAVEHVARTEDLNTKIPADGRDEIARLSSSFNMMTAALANSRELQQQLVADAGHELRTPLTSLRTNIDLLLRSESSGRKLPAGEARRLLSTVKAQLVELSGLVSDLLELSRPHGAAARDGAERVPVHEIVARAVQRARLRGPQQRIETAIEPWYASGRAAALERAIVNLLDNAVKFSPPDAVIDVRLRRPPPGGSARGQPRAELTVRDHGPGIPAEDRAHVFERFWRSPSARGLPGTGLGLAIVAQAVGDAGGSVALEPADGGGTLARVLLPGVPDARRAVTGPLAARHAGRGPGSGAPGKAVSLPGAELLLSLLMKASFAFHHPLRTACDARFP
jgi:two-component system, OmpR family, sensor histidine kinase MprB